MDDAWLYYCPIGRDDTEPALFALPDEEHDLREVHPEVVAKQRARIEEVIDQPLDSVRFNEVCGPAPAPYQRWLSARG